MSYRATFRKKNRVTDFWHKTIESEQYTHFQSQYSELRISSTSVSFCRTVEWKTL